MHSRGIPNARAFRSIRLMATLIAILATVLGTTVPSFASSGPVAASSTSSVAQALSGGPVKASLDGFSAGNIISDATFANSSSMTEAQIQAFFNAKVPTCRGGSDQYGAIVCLKDYRANSVNRPADRYCNGYTGAANESAARIIYRVAQSCNINPQVLIVMLQKEQGLVTHTWPSAWRYDKALGQGCPDDAPCNPAYVGFFYQIYGAARQMQIYMEGVYFKYYAPGNTWSILYHPNRACGTAPVYVANKATSALYYYTPYQPNAAALRAGYGEGDGCSSYGNRNFYNYFTDWFGSTQATSAQVLIDSSSNVSYLVTQGKKFRFPTSERAIQFTWLSAARVVPSAQLANYADGGVAPRAVRTDAGYVYLLDSGRRFTVPSCARATDFGWDCGTLPMVGQGQVALYPDAGGLEPSITALGSSWLIQGSARREIVDRSILLHYGMSSGASAVSDAMASEYAVGAPVFGAGVYSTGADKMFAILQNGAVYDVSMQGQVPGMKVAARHVSQDSSEKLARTGTLPLSVKAAGRTYILGANGWLDVNAYGSLVSFADLGADSLAGMPSAGQIQGAHFVREQSSVQVFLVSGGTIQAANAEQQRWISATFLVPAQVQVIADGALGGRAAPSQRLVRTSAGTAYLLDGVNRFRFIDCAQVADWGADCGQLADISATDVAQYTDRGTLQRLIRESNGTTWLIQSGTRREVVDVSILAQFGIGGSTSTVSTSMVGALPVGAPVLASGVYSNPSGGMVLANQAGNFTVSAAVAQLPIVTQTSRRLTAESFALLSAKAGLATRIISDGRALILTERGWLQVDAGQYGGAKAFSVAAPSSWVGLPLAGSDARPHFVRDRTSSQTFLVSGGILQVIDGDAARTWLAAYFGLSSQLWPVVEGGLNGLSLTPGLMYRDSDGRMSITDGSSSYTLGDCSLVAAFGKDCTAIPTVSDEALALKDGGQLALLLRAPGGDIWLAQDGNRREVPDVSILAAFGIPGASAPVSTELLHTLKFGEPVLGGGMYRSPSGEMRLVAGSTVLNVPAGAQVDAVKSASKPLTAESFATLKPSADLALRVTNGGGAYVLATQGWARVDAANYGARAFTAVSDAVMSAVPMAPAATGARFVREASSSQVYLASGGLTPMTAEQQAWATATYGVPSTVVVVADGVLG